MCAVHAPAVGTRTVLLEAEKKSCERTCKNSIGSCTSNLTRSAQGLWQRARRTPRLPRQGPGERFISREGILARFFARITDPLGRIVRTPFSAVQQSFQGGRKISYKFLEGNFTQSQIKTTSKQLRTFQGTLVESAKSVHKDAV